MVAAGHDTEITQAEVEDLKRVTKIATLAKKAYLPRYSALPLYVDVEEPRSDKTGCGMHKVP